MNEYNFIWLNLENLFDVENSPNRTEKIGQILKGELRGWTPDILDKKIEQISKVISKTKNGNGPDILGVCEVKNKPVLEMLVNKLQSTISRNYRIVHADTKDKRGIDLGFIYDGNKFKIEKDALTGEDLIFSHYIVKREATRDLLQVNFKSIHSNKRLIIIGNHWPSKSGGQYESEPYRIVAG